MCATEKGISTNGHVANGRVPEKGQVGTSFFDRLGTARKRSLPKVIFVHLATRLKYCFLQWFGLKALLR